MGLPDQEYYITRVDSTAISDTRTTSDSANTSILVAPITDITKAGSGARIHLELFSDGSVSPQLELGAYSRFVNQRVDPYISVALPLAVRLYVASGMQIDYADDADDMSTQVDDELGVSGGFLYTRGFGRGGTLSLGGEALYKNDVTKLQLNTSWGFNRVFALVLRGDATLENNIYSVVLGPQLTPEAGYTISVFSITSIDIDDDADKNSVYTGASVVMQYKY